MPRTTLEVTLQRVQPFFSLSLSIFLFLLWFCFCVPFVSLIGTIERFSCHDEAIDAGGDLCSLGCHDSKIKGNVVFLLFADFFLIILRDHNYKDVINRCWTIISNLLYNELS